MSKIMTRKKLSPDTQRSVLTESRRKCCLCYGLKRDFSVKKGQIAHIDHDSSNDKESNLVFLCFDHHDEYDSTTRQSKGLTKDELVHYKNKLYKEVGSVAITETALQPVKVFNEMQLKHDQRIFEISDSIFSEDNLNTILRTLLHDNFYILDSNRKMEEFYLFFQKSSNAFLNEELTLAIQPLVEKLDELDDFLAHNFFVESGYSDNPRFRLYPEMKYDNNEKYIGFSRQVDSFCSEVSKLYKIYRLTVKRNLFL
jgi:hypothetical protein